MATPPFLLPQRAAPLVNTGSAMDRHMSTGLSGQSPRPVGRSMNDPQRQQQIAMRRMRSQGDIEGSARLAQSQAWLDARFLGRNAPMMPAGAMPVLPSSPAADANAMPTGGRLVPGRSAGSMVVQRETPPVIDVPTETPPLSPVPMMPAPAAAPAAMPIVPEGMNPLTGMPLANAPSMMPEGFVAMNRNNAALGLPLPPSGLYGPETAPRFQEYQAGDMNLIVDSTTGKQVQSYKRPQPVGYEPVPGMNLLLPKGDGAERLPLLQQQGMMEAPRPEAAFMGPMPGRPKLAAYTPPTQPTDTPKIPEGIQYEKDAMGKIIGGVYPTYNDQGKLVMRRIDLDGDGVVSPAERAAAMQAAGQTPGGVKFSRVQ